MLSYKPKTILLSIIFTILAMCGTASSLTLPRQLTGTLQAGGTDFDDFVTQSGNLLILDKHNPKIEIIYQTCGYGKECDILAYIEDDAITEISTAFLVKNNQQKSNFTNNIQNKHTSESIISQPPNVASSAYPSIKGINLGMSYMEAQDAVRKLPISGEDRAEIHVYPEDRGIRSFIFFTSALRALYNIEKIDINFLKKFLTGYKLKGKQINFDRFSKKYMYPHERNRSVYGLFTPISFFGGLFGYSDSTIFWDCGDYCVVLAPDSSKGHSSYIGFAKKVVDDKDIDSQTKNKKLTTFD